MMDERHEGYFELQDKQSSYNLIVIGQETPELMEYESGLFKVKIIHQRNYAGGAETMKEHTLLIFIIFFILR